jgi:DNA-directed RNA polymerase specialized sigma subunit
MSDSVQESQKRHLSKIRPHGLSPQEYQIFAEIAFDGKSIADIAKELGVSDKYVYRINARTTQKIKDYLSSSLSDTAACA